MDRRAENLNNQTADAIRHEIDKKLALAFFSCSFAFKAIDNPYLRDFIETLSRTNIPYSPPSRQTLAGPILDAVYEEFVKVKIHMLKDTFSVLLCDGWKNKSSNKKLIVFSLRNIHATQIYLTYKDFSELTEDGNNLSINITNAIDFAKDTYGTQVYGLMTDNDKKIVCGGERAVNADDDFLWQATCSSHSGNLLIKTFADEDLIEKLRLIINVFRDSKLDSILRVRFKGTKLQDFPDTRFCYLRKTCVSVVSNLEKLRAVVNLQDVIVEQKIMELLYDDDLENRMVAVIAIVDPVCELINTCQNPNTNIADATQLWMTLELPGYEDALDARRKKALSPVGFAANMLHHKYQGLVLSTTQREIGEAFIYNKFREDALEELFVYQQRVAEFQDLANRIICPIKYWGWLKLQFPKLADYAIKLMLMPASTAQLESLFSSWTYIHNIYRNKLGMEKSSQLLDMYHCMKKLDLKLYERDPFELENV